MRIAPVSARRSAISNSWFTSFPPSSALQLLKLLLGPGPDGLVSMSMMPAPINSHKGATTDGTGWLDVSVSLVEERAIVLIVQCFS